MSSFIGIERPLSKRHTSKAVLVRHLRSSAFRAKRCKERLRKLKGRTEKYGKRNELVLLRNAGWEQQHGASAQNRKKKGVKWTDLGGFPCEDTSRAAKRSRTKSDAELQCRLGVLRESSTKAQLTLSTKARNNSEKEELLPIEKIIGVKPRHLPT